MSEPPVSAGRVFALCFATGLCEGYDMLVAGVAAPHLSRVLGLGAQQVGWVFGAAGIGLLIGALAGGRIADLAGRRRVLVASLVVLGLFSIASALIRDLPALLAMRFLAGLGLGGALPNILALVNETSPAGRTTTRVTMLGSAMPFGGAFLGALTVTMPGLSWQAMFWIGGLAPLLVALACQFLLPAFPPNSGDRPRETTVGFALTGEQRAVPTALLWVTTLCVAISVAMMVNWLPSLMIARDFDRAATGRIVMTLTLGGAASGFAFGALARRLNATVVHGLAWAGMIASVLLMLVAGRAELAAAAASFGLGFFLSGGQFLLYGVATDLYPRTVRGTGTGFAVSVGRFGAVLGPLLAGALLARTGNPDHAILALLPLLLLSLATVRWLSRTRVPDPSERVSTGAA
ncbi:MFS transporter [Sphingomonas sp.]|uniref:MFS transporter n=1 Tax=Sphingomonas sp. TaxID=28214 RepID=UPI001B007D6C|nr:MFS transporter [Sphingomonas sp.]MBO9711749.1 MFS transporter [Sphingomonas sp.]